MVVGKWWVNGEVNGEVVCYSLLYKQMSCGLFVRLKGV